ncbi:1-acyl-sn-glycerol-3-phosphate acyltransferase, partial [Frankia sp. CN7]|nr:1-acyl-sn-glycerol-3-phosphate acyltransferase [Frankia nepalensis]
APRPRRGGRPPPPGGRGAPPPPPTRQAFLGGIMTPLLHSQLTWTTRGAEVFDDLGDTPALIVANHSSHLDATVLLCALPAAVRERTVVTAAADYFFESTWRGLSTALAFGTVPIDRSGGAPSTTPVDLLRDGWNLVIFPEGTRSADGARARFKLGAAFLAINTGVPVVPVGLRGAFAAMPRGRSWPVPGRPEVAVRFGKPMRPGEGDDVRGFTTRLAAEVDRLVAEDETSWWSSLPRPKSDGPATPAAAGTGAAEPARWRKVWAATEPPASTRPRSPWAP